MRAAVQITVPADIRAACRAFEAGAASEGQQRRLWRYIVYELSGLTRLEDTISADAETQLWRAGSRFVGAFLEHARVMEDAPELAPRPRTATARVRERNSKV